MSGPVLPTECRIANAYAHGMVPALTDDLVHFAGTGIAMNMRQTAPREILTWRTNVRAGDMLNFYTHGDFRRAGSAKIMAVEEIKDSAL